MLLNIHTFAGYGQRMKQISLFCAALACLALPAHADCYAEYKAKKDDPLRLHYGILLIEADICPDPKEAEVIVQDRLADTQWTLLNVIGLSKAAPSKEQESNAGTFYLRF